MRDFLRFILSEADRDRVDSGSVVTEDVSAAPATDYDPPPQSLRLRFNIQDPAGGAPQLRPIFPGAMTFTGSPTATGATPNPNEVELTSAKFAAWKTEGRLRVQVLNKKILGDLRSHIGALEILPTCAWYAPVKLSEGFLFTTLAGDEGLKRRSVATSTTRIPTGAESWPRHAIAGFLKGAYQPHLRLGTDAASDDVIRFDMPTLVMAADGSVELVITLATWDSPTDGRPHAFNGITPTAARVSPSHARCGTVPARHAYRLCRAHMIGAPAGNAVADAVLMDWPATRRYVPVQFTRTWLRTLSSGDPVKNYSIHFPRQKVRITNADGSVRMEMKLPAHGFCYVPVEPAESGAAAIDVAVRIVEGGMRWIDGATANCWRSPAGTTPVAIDLATNPSPHIIARLPMSEAVLIERRDTPGDKPGGFRCTYMSLRRCVRALVDNRIAGGRLNFKRTPTAKPTQDLIAEAWDETGVAANKRHGATVSIVRNGKPLPSVPDYPKEARRLEKVMIAFLPDRFEAEPPADNPSTQLRKGEIFYALWQTIAKAFGEAATRDNFSDDDVGKGSAAALVATGFAQTYAVNTDKDNGETDNQLLHRIATEMMTNLKPGAVLQLRNTLADHTLARQRQKPSSGHSLIFLRYISDDTGVTKLRIIDQGGERDCKVTGTSTDRRIEWGKVDREVWNAANWDE